MFNNQSAPSGFNIGCISLLLEIIEKQPAGEENIIRAHKNAAIANGV